MSMSQPHLSHSKRLIDRRSVLLGGAAGLAGAVAGVQPLRAQSSDEGMLDMLIAMDDLDVRKAVGATFLQYLRCTPPVKATFFPDATPPDVTIDPQFTTVSPDPLRNAGYPLAEALVAWALANTSAYGFNSTVNGQNAEHVVNGFCALNSGKGSVVRVSEILYTSLFPQRAKYIWTKFAWFLDTDKRDHFADLLSAALISDYFFVKAMARKKADPTNFPQYVHMQLFKLRTLLADVNSGSGDPRYKKVLDKWTPYLNGQPWTTYQYLTVDKFSEQTFMPEVQAAVGAATVVGRHSGGTFCAGGSNARCHTSYIDDYNHGLAVEAWLKGAHEAPSYIFTGTAPDNKQ